MSRRTLLSWRCGKDSAWVLHVCYQLAPITYWLGRFLVKIPFIGLPNIVAGKAIAKEFIQRDTNPNGLATEALRLLTDTAYADQQRAGLAQVRQQLGAGGASKVMAGLVLGLLGEWGGRSRTSSN